MAEYTALDRSFFERPIIELTEALIGQLIVRKHGDDVLVGRIVETEAYGGPSDPSAHSFSGVTARCFAMYGPAGRSYVYATQGRCFCMNIIAEGSGKGRGVLVRAVEPVSGVSSMLKRRKERLGSDSAKKKLESELHELGKGPGRLCLCFDITREHNYIDVTNPDSILYLAQGSPAKQVRWTRRIGLNAKSTSHDWKWRCYDVHSRAVSGSKGDFGEPVDAPIPNRCPSPSPEVVEKARPLFERFHRLHTESNDLQNTVELDDVSEPSTSTDIVRSEYFPVPTTSALDVDMQTTFRTSARVKRVKPNSVRDN